MSGPPTPANDTGNEAADPSEDGRSARAHARRERRRAKILDAAVRVFSDLGYHQARVADIIEAASIARGTFYLYFESKNAIFLELLGDFLDHLRDSVAGVDTGAGAAPVGAQLHGIVRRLLAAVASKRALTAILVREAVGLDEEVDRLLQGFYDNLHALIADSLERGQRIGLVRDPLDVEMAATSILGAMRLVLERELVPDRPQPPDLDRLAAAILDYHGRALLRLA